MIVFGCRASEALPRATTTAWPGMSNERNVKVRLDEVKVPEVGVLRSKCTLAHPIEEASSKAARRPASGRGEARIEATYPGPGERASAPGGGAARRAGLTSAR